MDKTVCCKFCSAKIATDSDGKLVIDDMKTVSAIEIVSGETPGWTNVKCRKCGNWNLFIDGTQIINYKRKAQDALHNSARR